MIGKGHFMMQAYQGGIREQRRMWKPVEEEIAKWRRHYIAMHQHPGFTPVLFYRDGGSFLMIYHRQLNKDPTVHRLPGSSRDIYRFCEEQRSTAEIVSKFPGFGEDRIKPFLQMMADKRLMFSENDRHLSLAVSVRQERITKPIKGCQNKLEFRYKD